MKRIYISIPISGHDLNEQRHKADLVKAKLSRLGWKAISPFDIYAGKNPTYEDYICSDLRALMECDAVYFCKGWNQSTGCKIERSVATIIKEKNGKPKQFIFECNQ